MNASLSPKFRFGAEAKVADVSFSSPHATVGESQAPLTNAEYLRQSCAQMQIPVGPRDHSECPPRVTLIVLRHLIVRHCIRPLRLYTDRF